MEATTTEKDSLIANGHHLSSSTKTRLRTLDRSTDKSSYGSSVIIEQEKVSLKRTIGLVQGTSFIVGTVIGTGIFISPKGVLEGAGSVALTLILWTLSGLVAILGALCYAELGTFIRKSGADYVYLQEAFGPVPAFMFAWTTMVVKAPSGLAIIALTFSEYMGTLFPFCGSSETLTKLVAVTVIITLLIINCYDARLAASFQVLFTFTKLAALGIIIVGGIVRLAEGHTDELRRGFEGTSSSVSAIALGFYNSLWAYDGWNGLNAVTEEIRDPQKNLPRANIIGILIVTVVYLLTNMSYFTAMTSAEMLSSSAVAVTWGDRILGSASIILPISVLCSSFGGGNGALFLNGRISYVAAREGHLPGVLSYVQAARFTPLPSLVVTGVLAICFVIPSGISDLINVFSFASWIFYGSSVAGLVYLRFKRPNAERPIKLPIIVPMIFVVCAVYLVIAPIIEDPKIDFLYVILFILGGLIFYVPFIHFKLLPNLLDGVTVFFQLFLEVVPSTYKPDKPKDDVKQ